MRILALAFTVFLALGAAPAFAKNKPVGDKERPEAIAKAEQYLNSLEDAQARFVQTTHDGTQLVGTFYLSRPGKLRFEYDPPIEDFVVADGLFIYFYDAQLGEQTNAPIGNTLADFFLRKEMHLSDDITVKDIVRGGGLLQIELTQTADPEAGTLTLGFEENPYTLKKWRVVDAQGLITEVELFYLKTDIKHPYSLFVYADPKGRKKVNE